MNELARLMTRGAFEQLRGYAERPAEVKDVEIAATARHGLRLLPVPTVSVSLMDAIVVPLRAVP
ncbi:hypothetical protein [Streptomyces inhibens]|uniref:hypothetical protein n=1 Tax=Streptomyces inhibens TaxID=2293571 RepID=UPI001FD370C1|nr:hypothetical protein [Streptomyces inhibens]